MLKEKYRKRALRKGVKRLAKTAMKLSKALGTQADTCDNELKTCFEAALTQAHQRGKKGALSFYASETYAPLSTAVFIVSGKSGKSELEVRTEHEELTTKLEDEIYSAMKYMRTFGNQEADLKAFLQDVVQ